MTRPLSLTTNHPSSPAMAAALDPLATDRLAELEQVPGRLIYEGGRIECRRGNEWIPGTIVGTPDQIDRDRPLEIQVNLDWPDRSGHTEISTDSFKIRAISGAVALQQAAE